ncbi:YbaB/EbfC family nucleoid-associated protein [Gordonia iterans]|nr:YbaB/EbfC family nucleoid-associated protein [Gordonia iterans]
MTSAMDQITARAQARLAALQHAHRELAGVSATASADDGRVVVRVDASGGLADLTLRPGAARGDATRLAAVITETAATAARDVAQRRADLTREFLDEFGDPPDGEAVEHTDRGNDE